MDAEGLRFQCIFGQLLADCIIIHELVFTSHSRNKASVIFRDNHRFTDMKWNWSLPAGGDSQGVALPWCAACHGTPQPWSPPGCGPLAMTPTGSSVAYHVPWAAGLQSSHAAAIILSFNVCDPSSGANFVI